MVVLSFTPLSTRRDWLCSSSRLRFYHLACLGSSAGLFLFVVFPTFPFAPVQLFLIYRLSPRSLRNHYLTLPLFSIKKSCNYVRNVNEWKFQFVRNSLWCKFFESDSRLRFVVRAVVWLTLLRFVLVRSVRLFFVFWRVSLSQASSRIIFVSAQKKNQIDKRSLRLQVINEMTRRIEENALHRKHKKCRAFSERILLFKTTNL